MVISKITKKQEDFIEGKETSNSEEYQSVLLRIPKTLLVKIEESMQDRPIKVPRNTWILEAIYRYLKD